MKAISAAALFFFVAAIAVAQPTLVDDVASMDATPSYIGEVSVALDVPACTGNNFLQFDADAGEFKCRAGLSVKVSALLFVLLAALAVANTALVIWLNRILNRRISQSISNIMPLLSELRRSRLTELSEDLLTLSLHADLNEPTRVFAEQFRALILKRLNG